jgi:hypothetical protein
MAEEAESQLGTVSKPDNTVLYFVLAWDSVLAARPQLIDQESAGRGRDEGEIGEERKGKG